MKKILKRRNETDLTLKLFVYAEFTARLLIDETNLYLSIYVSIPGCRPGGRSQLPLNLRKPQIITSPKPPTKNIKKKNGTTGTPLLYINNSLSTFR